MVDQSLFNICEEGMLRITHNLETQETTVVEHTEPRYVPTTEEKAARQREKRNSELKLSDWTQLSDAPVDQSAWATYRQSLRDVPSQAGFPDNVTWPTKPE